ncbi:MAG: sulfatase-like hydrolase/transferase [Acidobacteriota bacterium]
MVLATALVSPLLSCGRADRAALWEAKWERRQVGARWLSGLMLADERGFAVAHDGVRLRATLFNQTEGPLEASLRGSPGERRFRVEPGQPLSLDVDTPPGDWVLAAPLGVFATEPRLVQPRTDAETLVLVLVDALRDDAVKEQSMPRTLAAFARGRRFRDVTTNATWTLPSLATLFTGRPVFEISGPDGTLIAIPSGATTWPEALQRAGFSGAGVSANFSVHELNGFGAGFASFWVPKGYDPATGHPDVDVVLAEGRRWLASHRGEKCFLYLHLMDTHEPYHDHDAASLRPAPVESISPLANGARIASAAETRQRRAFYDREVTVIDAAIATFLDSLPRHAIMALTADHGESFAEHGAWGHGFTLYEEQARVPLLLKGDGVPPGEDLKPSQLLDLAPTLLELAHVPLPAEMSGRSLLSGGSAQPIVSATFAAGPLRWAWRSGQQKLILHTQQPPELATGKVVMGEVRPLATGAFRFDLASDPREERPLSLDVDFSFAAAQAFAATAGRLTLGWQLLAAGVSGPISLSLGGVPGARLLHASSTAAVAVAVAGATATVQLAEGSPFALLAFAADAAASPPSLSSSPRLELSAPSRPPARIAKPGLYLWWNDRAPTFQRSQEETIRRLRNLGYLQ